MRTRVSLISAFLICGCGDLEMAFKGGPSRGELRPLKKEVIDVSIVNYQSRRFITHKLEFIFGQSQANFIRNFMTIPIFGEPCNIYERNTFRGVDLCNNNISNTSIPFSQYSTSSKYGSMIQICYKVVEDEESLGYALKIVNDQAEIYNEFEQTKYAANLFYPIHTLSYKTLQKLHKVREISQERFEGDPREGWRFTFLTLCLSTGWLVR